MRQQLERFRADAIHIATEGPLGHAAHRYCATRSLPFTTSYHTRFPEYLRLRAPVPLRWSYAYLRRFHAAAEHTLVPTESQRALLLAKGFARVRLWSRGVDTSVFTPDDAVRYPFPRPIMVYMGRVAIEKNIDEFLRLDLPGSKVVIGDGPDRQRLQATYPDARFLGSKFNRDLARHLAGGDVFVFPSRTDTFGLVLLEAMACGLPVAAFPVTGPRDVIKSGLTGILDEDLASAIRGALSLDRRNCRMHAEQFSWDRCTAQFESYMVSGRTRPSIAAA
jgi:glycosyltransferase involved in cell wall biosynthesis